MSTGQSATIAALVVAVGLATSGCQLMPQQAAGPNLGDARTELLRHVDAVSQLVGSEWIDLYEPATFECGLRGGTGLQWTLDRDGVIDGIARDAVAVVTRYFDEQGLDARVRTNSPSDIDVIVRAESGLDLQFTAVDHGYAGLAGQSACVAAEQ